MRIIVANSNMLTNTHGRPVARVEMQQPSYSPPIAAEFTDYSRWERRPSNKSGTSGGWSVGRGGKGRTLGSKHQQGCWHDGFSLATRLSQASTLGSQAPDNVQRSQRLHSHCHGSIKKQSSCSPPQPVRTRHSTSSCGQKISKAQAALSPQYTILQMQIEARRNTIKEFTQYKDDLLAANLQLIGVIRESEDSKHCAVQELLEKYRKSRGSVAALKKKTHQDREDLLAELKRAQQSLLNRQDNLRKEVREAEVLLQAKVKERDILKGFKEKEFMVNQVTIEQLRDEIKEHTQGCEEAITKLSAEISEEREIYRKMMAEKRREIEAHATEKCISRMKRSVKEKGIQNKIMEKEIILHCHKAEAMRESIEDLQLEIRQLRLALHEDQARRDPLMFVEKCLPDTELHLNIPVQNFPPFLQPQMTSRD